MRLPHHAPLAAWGRQLRRYVYLCRLNRPADLALFLLPGLWASLLAGGGRPDWADVIALLLAAALVRCGAWVFNDWMESRLLPEAPESYLAHGVVSLREEVWLLGLLLGSATLLLLPLPATVFYYAWAAPLLLVAYPFLKTRLLLSQAYLGLCFAWLVPMAFSAQGGQPNKTAWLVFTATLLWASAFATLYALPRQEYERRVGIRSVTQLFGGNSWLFILLLQLGAIFSLWLAGRQMALGIFFSLGLIAALLLIPYQLWLQFTHPLEGPLRSYRSQIWSAITILCGIGFHFLCQS